MTDVSSFPTKILLATDGSKEAKRASTTSAINLAKSHHAELHVVFVEPALPMIDQFAEVRALLVKGGSG